jgi:hypothetical protein
VCTINGQRAEVCTTLYSEIFQFAFGKRNANPAIIPMNIKRSRSSTEPSHDQARNPKYRSIKSTGDVCDVLRAHDHKADRRKPNEHQHDNHSTDDNPAQHGTGRNKSALGQKQTFAPQKVMSALPSPKRTCAVQLGMSAMGQKQTWFVFKCS